MFSLGVSQKLNMYGNLKGRNIKKMVEFSLGHRHNSNTSVTN